MSKPLRSLADIHIGHSFRTGIENDPQGDIHVLQIRDIRASTDIQVDSLPRVKWSISGKPPLLMPGDVVLPSRGDRYDAALIRSKTPMLASGHLYILHPRTSGLTPEFLRWYLNQRESQNYILKNRAGTGIPTLGRQVLEDLPVPVPTLETQREIIALQQLLEQEKSLTQQLLANRRKMLDGIFSKLLES